MFEQEPAPMAALILPKINALLDVSSENQSNINCEMIFLLIFLSGFETCFGLVPPAPTVLRAKHVSNPDFGAGLIYNL